MNRIVTTILLAVLAQSSFAEVNVPTLEELLNRHCTHQCRHGPAAEVNMTLVEEMVQERMKQVESRSLPASCADVHSSFAKLTNTTGGVYTIYPLGMGAVEVYCDSTDGGNWTVFQRRMDGSVDFYRGWEEYKNGFGESQGEFWLGLEAMHQLTKTGNFELRIDMIGRRDGTYRYAQYQSFSIGSESSEYKLFVSGYSGNATDSMRQHNRQPFTTKDSDHDDSPSTNCASRHTGAWWYASCYFSNLNGRYESTGTGAIRWWVQIFPDYPIALSFSEMKFRKKL